MMLLWDDIELINVDDSFNLSTPEDLADIYDS